MEEAIYQKFIFIQVTGVVKILPRTTSPDFIVVCGNFGTPNTATIGTESRWGNGSGSLRFAFIDASCPMDLVSITNSWFPPFQGLHMAIGHSDSGSSDTLEYTRIEGDRFPLLRPEHFGFILILAFGDALMVTGTIDIQSGCCAVIPRPAGVNRDEAIDRRENERVKDDRSNPSPNWFAWKWVCA